MARRAAEEALLLERLRGKAAKAQEHSRKLTLNNFEVRAVGKLARSHEELV